MKNSIQDTHNFTFFLNTIKNMEFTFLDLHIHVLKFSTFQQKGMKQNGLTVLDTDFTRVHYNLSQ